jgi:hypothetical protein
MAMLVVVPVEEGRYPLACVGQTLEAFGRIGPILQGLELRLRKRVVIRGVRVALGHPQSLQQLGYRLRRHRSASVSMQVNWSR